MAQDTGTTTHDSVETVEQLRDLTTTLAITEETAVLVGENGDVWRIELGILSCLTRPTFETPQYFHVHTDNAIGAFLPLNLIWTGEYRP